MSYKFRDWNSLTEKEKKARKKKSGKGASKKKLINLMREKRG